MSLLTKIFILVVFMSALVALGVQMTLFSQRVDWKDKFIKETHYHYQTIAMKDSEIGYQKLEVQNRNLFIDGLQKRIALLKTQNDEQQTKIADLDRNYNEVLFKMEKLIADIDSFSKQLEVQMAQIKDREVKLIELRDKIGKLSAERTTAATELQYVRQELERTAKDLANLEERHMSIVKEKRRAEDTLEYLASQGISTQPGPSAKFIEGKVMQYSDQVGVAVINQGRDAGVLVGMKFTIYRSDKFVATATVRESERDWAILMIDLKNIVPQVGDDVSNHLLVTTAPHSPSK